MDLKQKMPKRDEGRLLLIREGHLDLVVTRVGVEEAQQLGAGYGVDDLVDPRQSKRVLGACAVQVGVVDAHAPGAVLLQHQDRVRQPRRVDDLHDKPSGE